MRRKFKKQHCFNDLKTNAFSLVELMIVVAIIAVIAQVAVPKYKVFVAKARQSEVKLGLKTIFALQSAYRDAEGVFKEGVAGNRAESPNECMDTSLASIGFRVDCSRSKYTYLITYATDAEFAGHGFISKNESICSCTNPVYGRGAHSMHGV